MTIQTGMNYTVFSKEGCPYCDKIKQVLELTGSNFVVYTLGDQFDKESKIGSCRGVQDLVLKLTCDKFDKKSQIRNW